MCLCALSTDRWISRGNPKRERGTEPEDRKQPKSLADASGYASLKKELVHHFSNINAEYPDGGSPAALNREEPKTQRTATAPASQRQSQDQFFKSRDRNKDGAVTLEEFIGNPEGRNVPALTKRFKNSDSNGDGKLQLDELKEQTN